MERFADRVAVVTGGASGIGLAMARSFAREGCKLVLADVNAQALDHSVAELSAAGTDVIGVQTDVGEQAQVQALADTAFSRFGAVHILANNAGVATYAPISELTHADWEWSIRVNLWGVIHGIECFLPRMRTQNDEGYVLNTASFAGLSPSEKLGAYCAAKYAVVGLSECLARELRSTPIGVSVLCPMTVRTNIWQSSGENRPAELGGPAAHRVRSEEEWKHMKSQFMTAEETAELVIQGMRKRQLFIFTHREGRELLRKRFERIDRCFDQ